MAAKPTKAQRPYLEKLANGWEIRTSSSETLIATHRKKELIPDAMVIVFHKNLWLEYDGQRRGGYDAYVLTSEGRSALAVCETGEDAK